jgi:sRNA-binding protein
MKSQEHIGTLPIIQRLSELCPQAIFTYEQRRRPLKVGAYNDLLALVAGSITPDELKLALKVYTRNPYYQKAMAQPGAMRIDCEGNEVEPVKPDQAASAARALAAHWARQAARKAKAREAEAPAGPVHSSPAPMSERPKRLSLADLRQSAFERRKATA